MIVNSFFSSYMNLTKHGSKVSDGSYDAPFYGILQHTRRNSIQIIQTIFFAECTFQCNKYDCCIFVIAKIVSFHVFPYKIHLYSKYNFIGRGRGKKCCLFPMLRVRNVNDGKKSKFKYAKWKRFCELSLAPSLRWRQMQNVFLCYLFKIFNDLGYTSLI